MFYKYKRDYEKITMGLLSFIPDLKNVANLKSELVWYQQNENRCIFLWKDNKNNFVGVLGVEIEEEYLLIRQIAVTPSARNKGISFEMLDTLQANYADKKILGSIDTTDIIKKWEMSHATK